MENTVATSTDDDQQSYADRAHAKTAFARRLNHELLLRGMNGSDLARRASSYMPEGKHVSRDNISNYLRGLHLPGRVNLNAIARALSLEPSYLLPDRANKRITREQPEFSMRDIGNGKVFLRVNQEVPFDVAARIASILAEKS